MRALRAGFTTLSITLLLVGWYFSGSLAVTLVIFVIVALITAAAQIGLRGSFEGMVLADLIVAAELALVAIAVGIDPYAASDVSPTALGGVSYGYAILLSWELGEAG